MDRRSSFLIGKPAPDHENPMTSHLLPPLITAFIVLILGLIGLFLT